MKKFVYIDGTHCEGYAPLDVANGHVSTMTVRDLIAALSAMPADAAVILGNNFADSTVATVKAVG